MSPRRRERQVNLDYGTFIPITYYNNSSITGTDPTSDSTWYFYADRFPTSGSTWYFTSDNLLQ